MVASKPRDANGAVLIDLQNETTRLQTRIAENADSGSPGWALLKLAKVFYDVYKRGKDALQGASSVDQRNSAPKELVPLAKTKSTELQARCTKIEQKMKAMLVSKVLREPAVQPTPAIDTADVSQLSHEHEGPVGEWAAC